MKKPFLPLCLLLCAWPGVSIAQAPIADAVGAWGQNSSGQTTVPVAAQSGVTAIAAGAYHTVALKNDGSVVVWGDNGSGQTTVPVAAQGRLTAIAAGAYHTVALSGNYAYVAGESGLQVIDVRNPTNCVRVGGYDTSGIAYGVAVVAGRIYVADGAAGLVVLPTVPNVQFTVRVNATTNLNTPIPWTPLLTTNVPVMPFDFVDFDVKLSEKPQKFYRVHQP